MTNRPQPLLPPDARPGGPDPAASVIDPGRFLVLVRRHWFWLLLPPLLAGVAGWFLSARADSRYEASTLVVIRPTAAGDLLEGDRSSALAERELQTEERLLDGPAMAELVRDRLGSDVDFEASAIEGTDLIEIRAQAGDEEGAATAADDIATLFIEQRRARIDSDLTAAIEVVEAEVERLRQTLADAEPTDDNVQARLQREIEQAETSLDRLRSEAALPGNEARIASPAVAPDDRVSPRPSRAAVLGAMLGLLVGLGLVWLRDLLDRRIRGVDDLPDVAIDLEFAGPVPRPATGSLSGPAIQVHRNVADRFRVLANASLGGRGDRFVIQVTGVAGGEGATFVAANLAAALATGGWSTALIDADLEHGDQHRIFRVEPGPGTRELLDGAPLERVLQQTPVAHGLSLIAAGARSAADATLHRAKLDELLAAVSSRFDIVVIDGPPILGAGDAAVLATHVDKTILVTSANHTTQPALERAIRTIAANEGQLSALVLVEPTNRPPARDGLNGTNGAAARQVTRESIETMATITTDIPLR